LHLSDATITRPAQVVVRDGAQVIGHPEGYLPPSKNLLKNDQSTSKRRIASDLLGSEMAYNAPIRDRDTLLVNI
jgi:hypothetical protein